MNKLTTLGALSILLVLGATAASAYMGGMGARMGEGVGFGSGADEGVREAMLNGNWAAYQEAITDSAAPFQLTEEAFLQMSERMQERSAIHEAVLSGDWATYSSLVGEFEISEGIHAQMTEEAFLMFSEHAQLMERARELRAEIADDLGLEEHMPDMRAGGMRRGRGIGTGIGMGPGAGIGMGPGAGIGSCGGAYMEGGDI